MAAYHLTLADIAPAVRGRLGERGIKAIGMARELGIHHDIVYRLTNEVGWPEAQTFCAILRYLGINPCSIKGRSSDAD